MYYKSHYPPLPQIPPQNVHNILFHRPDQADWPDYPLHVDPLTGASRSFRQFLETVRDGATAMGTDLNLGGLGIRAENGEIVGVLSENSMVFLSPTPMTQTNGSRRIALPCFTRYSP
ncbi:hypothetical protein JVT61DRAFT_924 [Boletus reticuloceps]|uniref:Uncharacterized protein n=1 Tax=Boletus reticuloceps TaxID=495285 RepID=A0A8I3ABU9_9AGAM|nr:hypothetical protein JVT61DRAFT_924 [Boletus reticuloceps]